MSQYAPSSPGDTAWEGRDARNSVAESTARATAPFTPEATPACRSSTGVEHDGADAHPARRRTPGTSPRTRHVAAHPARRR
ncbi:MAG: hypothetical protein L0I76_37460, partial [Pseudonocardia sp.]|nr:hypothetical protein [Pseudonocardia sp.]